MSKNSCEEKARCLKNCPKFYLFRHCWQTCFIRASGNNLTENFFNYLGRCAKNIRHISKTFPAGSSKLHTKCPVERFAGILFRKKSCFPSNQCRRDWQNNILRVDKSLAGMVWAFSRSCFERVVKIAFFFHPKHSEQIKLSVYKILLFFKVFGHWVKSSRPSSRTVQAGLSKFHFACPEEKYLFQQFHIKSEKFSAFWQKFLGMFVKRTFQGFKNFPHMKNVNHHHFNLNSWTKMANLIELKNCCIWPIWVDDFASIKVRCRKRLEVTNGFIPRNGKILPRKNIVCETNTRGGTNLTSRGDGWHFRTRSTSRFCHKYFFLLWQLSGVTQS